MLYQTNVTPTQTLPLPIIRQWLSPHVAEEGTAEKLRSTEFWLNFSSRCSNVQTDQSFISLLLMRQGADTEYCDKNAAQSSKKNYLVQPLLQHSIMSSTNELCCPITHRRYTVSVWQGWPIRFLGAVPPLDTTLVSPLLTFLHHCSKITS